MPFSSRSALACVLRFQEPFVPRSSMCHNLRSLRRENYWRSTLVDGERRYFNDKQWIFVHNFHQLRTARLVFFVWQKVARAAWHDVTSSSGLSQSFLVTNTRIRLGKVKIAFPTRHFVNKIGKLRIIYSSEREISYFILFICFLLFSLRRNEICVVASPPPRHCRKMFGFGSHNIYDWTVESAAADAEDSLTSLYLAHKWLLLLIISHSFFSNFFCTLLHFFLCYIHLEVIQEAFYFTFSTSLIRQICLEPVLYLFNHECRSSTPHTDDGWDPKRSWLEFMEISSEYTQQHWDHIHMRREMGNSSTFFRLLFFFPILSSSLYSSLIFIFIFFFSCQYNYSSSFSGGLNTCYVWCCDVFSISRIMSFSATAGMTRTLCVFSSHCCDDDPRYILHKWVKTPIFVFNSLQSSLSSFWGKIEWQRTRPRDF